MDVIGLKHSKVILKNEIKFKIFQYANFYIYSAKGIDYDVIYNIKGFREELVIKELEYLIDGCMLRQDNELNDSNKKIKKQLWEFFTMKHIN